MTQLTARTKGTLVSWDQWRTAQAAIQGRKKPKAAVTTAEKYVKSNKLTPFVTRTNGNGSFFARALRDGAEVQFKVTITTSGGRTRFYHAGLFNCDYNVVNYAVNGVDIELQRKLISKFCDDRLGGGSNPFTVESLLYCNDNPEFAARLLSDWTPADLFVNQGYDGFYFRLDFVTLANNHALLDRPRPRLGEINPVEVLGCPYEVSVWCERFISHRLRSVTDSGRGLYKSGPLALLINRMGYMRTLIDVVNLIKVMVNRGYFTIDYLLNKHPDVLETERQEPLTLVTKHIKESINDEST